MRLLLRQRQESDGQAWDRGASALMSPVGRLHLDEARFPARVVDTVDGALRMGAALRAAYQGNLEGQLPDEPEHAELLIAPPVSAPPSASPSDEQLLREDLLANDSLGG